MTRIEKMIENANNGIFESLFPIADECFWVKNIFGTYIGVVIRHGGFRLSPHTLEPLQMQAYMEKEFRNNILPYMFDTLGCGKVRIEGDTPEICRLAEKLGFRYQKHRRWFVLTRKRYYGEKVRRMPYFSTLPDNGLTFQ